MCSMTKSIQTFDQTYDEACGELLIVDYWQPTQYR